MTFTRLRGENHRIIYTFFFCFFCGSFPEAFSSEANIIFTGAGTKKGLKEHGKYLQI